MIRRTFISWDEPALPRAADLLAERYVSDGELDLGCVVVVLPGGRAGRRLEELLVERAEQRDAILTPPRATTAEGLPELLYEPERPLADATLARRLWARVLRDLDPEVRDAVFPRPPPADAVAEWHGLARLLDGLHRELGGERLDFEEVAGRCGEWGGYDDGRRWSALAGAQRAYLRSLEGLGRRDRESARLRALDDEAVSLDEDLWLIGVVDLPRVVADMVRELDGTVEVLVHAPEERAEGFDDLGLVRTDPWLEAEIPLSDARVEVCGRPPEQADAVLRFLRSEGPELAPEDVSVGVPDTSLVPYVEQRLEAFDVRHRDAAGTPMDRTRPYRLLESLAAYLDRRRFEDLAALLRHPDVERVLPREDVPSSADRFFERHLPARDTFRGEGPRSAAAGRFRDLRTTLSEELGLETLSGDRPVSEWMPRLLDVLVRVYGRAPLDRGDRRERRLLEACDRLLKAATSLHRLPSEVDESCGAPEALRLLLAETRTATIPPDPDRAAIELLGWLELHLDDAPELVITGFDDEHVPEAVGADLFLPNALRRRLRLVHDDRRYARDAYLLQAILRSRRRTTIVVGRRDADGDPRRPSRLLLATTGVELAERVETLFRERERGPGPTSRLGIEPGDHSSFRVPPEPVIRLEEPPRVLWVTDFGAFLADPYRYALRRVLELDELHDRAREMDALGFGMLAHRVLHRFGEGEAVHGDDPEAIRGELERLLRDEVATRFGGDVLPAVRLQIELFRHRLASFAAWQAERRRDGWRVVAVEAQPPGEGVPFEVDGEPVLLSGRIDRIERHERRDEWMLLDYKTGERASDPDDAHRDGEAWVDLQLPLYRHLLPAIAEAGLPTEPPGPDATVRLGYVSLPRSGEVESALASWSDEELARADETARSVVRRLREGRIAHDPDRRAPWRDDALEALIGGGLLVTAEPAVDGRAGNEPSGDGDGGRA